MSAPASTPGAGAPRRTAHGTIVGMPPVVRAPARLPELGSTTLKSVYSRDDVGPCSDAFHPERWSSPPPLGSDPIIPCDEPEDDGEEGLDVRVASAPVVGPDRTTPSGLAVLPPITSSEGPEESEALTVPRPAPVAPAPEAPHAVAAVPEAPHAVAAESEAPHAAPEPDEMVILPFSERHSGAERRVLLIAALASAATVIAGVCAAMLFL